MAKLSVIYGIDSNDMAESIASDALTHTAGGENAWGGELFDDSAKAKGTGAEPAPLAAKKDSPDSRAKAQGNH